MPTAFLLCLVSSFCPSNLSGLHLYKARVPLVASPLLPLYRFLLDHDTRPVFCCCRSWLVFEVEAKTKPGNHVYFNITASPAVAAPSPMAVMEATAASRAEVDTSRPFRSVRQAVEVFGDRYAGGGNGSSSNASSESSVKLSAPPAASSSMVLELDCLKKLEEDLAEAKGELVELRQRQAQMEVAMSSLSAQFSRGLAVFSSLGKGKEVAVVGAPATAVGEDEYSGHGRVRSDRWDESRAEEWMASLEYLPSLSEALAIKMIEDDLGGDGKGRKAKNAKNKAARKKHKKQRSGISLVGGMFCSKKAKSR